MTRRLFCLMAMLLGLLLMTSGPGGLGVASADPGGPEEGAWVNWFNTYVPNENNTPDVADNEVFERWQWEYILRAYPLVQFPAASHIQALAQKQSAPAVVITPAPLHVGPAGATVGVWANIGPSPMTGGQIGSTVPTRAMSGRVTTIAADPANPNVWYVGGANGGVWKSIDAGTTWVPLTDAQASLAMGAIAVAPSNSSIVYAGTGEGNQSGDSYGGAGVLKSTNAGASWTLVGANEFSGNAVTGLIVSPADPNVVLGTSTSAIFGRIFGLPPAPPATGIYKSTDGGISWTLNRPGLVSDIVAKPNDFTKMYAGLGDVVTSATNGLYRSTDSGDTWSLVNGPWTQARVGAVKLTMSQADPNTLYVSIQDAFNGGGTGGALLGLWVTNNAWAVTPTFTAIPTAATGAPGYCAWDVAFASAGNQCWYSHVIGADPANASTLYAGGIPLWKCDCTTPGAPVWTEISKTTTPSSTVGIHVDQHALAWAGTRLIVGNDGGVWSSLDGGASFADNNGNLAITQFYDGSVSPTDPNFAIGGSQDNGTEKYTGTASWPVIGLGDGADNFISTSNPTTNWAISSQTLFINRTTNGGASFTSVRAGITNLGGAPFVSRFEKCPSNDNFVVAGTTILSRTTNFFTGAPPLNWASKGGNFVSGISGLGFAPADATCGTYAAGSAAGSLEITKNDSAFVDWDPLSRVPNRAITDVEFDPTNSNIAYVTLSGFDQGTPGAPGHVFRTANALAGAATTWTNISPPVNIPFNSIVVGETPNVLYAATDLGVWRSINSGTSWSQFTPASGMPNVAVYELQMNRTTHALTAFTHGRSAFVMGTPSSGPAFTSLNNTTFNVLTPGTFTVTTSGGLPMTLTQTGALPAVVTFVDNGNGTATLSGTPSSGTVGVYPLTFTATNEGGPVTQSFTLTVAILTQTISFTAPATGIVGTSATLTATGGASGNPVVFSIDASSTPGACNVTGSNGSTLNYTGVGSCVVNANQAGNANYSPAPQVQGTVAVSLLPQAITFTAPASGTIGTSATLTATGGASGNPVVFSIDASSTTGTCNVSGANGSTLNFTGAGTCVVNANQAGNASYSAAPQVQRSVSVPFLTQTIVFNAPATGTSGTSVTLTATGGASGNPVVFSIDPSSAPGACNVTGPNGSTLNFAGAGACVVDANQAGNATYSAAPQVQRTINTRTGISNGGGSCPPPGVYTNSCCPQTTPITNNGACLGLPPNFYVGLAPVEAVVTRQGRDNGADEADNLHSPDGGLGN